MEIKPVRWESGAAIVVFPPEVDVMTAGTFRDQLLSVINEGPETLVIDMTSTTFCDSSGVNAVIRAYRRATAAGTEVKLVVGSTAVRRVFEVTKIDHLIPVHGTLADALSGTPALADGGAADNGAGEGDTVDGGVADAGAGEGSAAG